MTDKSAVDDVIVADSNWSATMRTIVIRLAIGLPSILVSQVAFSQAQITEPSAEYLLTTAVSTDEFPRKTLGVKGAKYSSLPLDLLRKRQEKQAVFQPKNDLLLQRKFADSESSKALYSFRSRIEEIMMPVIPRDLEGGLPLVSAKCTGSDCNPSVVKKLREVSRTTCEDAVLRYAVNRDSEQLRKQYIANCLSQDLWSQTAQQPKDWGDVLKAAVGLSVHHEDGVPDITCSGVIVQPGVLLTAKHCFFDPSLGQPLPEWDAVLRGDMELHSDLGRLTVRCLDGPVMVGRWRVTECQSSQPQFDLPNDWVVLAIDGLERHH